MIVVILAGGKGTRLSEETKLTPKPLVKIGSKPIIWHIIKFYQSYGLKDFIIAGGYKYKKINDYFLKTKIQNVNINVINTGLNTMNGGRLFKLKKKLAQKRFMVTYGDGLSNINLKKLIKHHSKMNLIATVTAVRPPARWGYLHLKGIKILKFEEKKSLNEGWINGGFFIFEPEIFKYLKNERDILEKNLMPKLVYKNQISAYKHAGFWPCMDNIKEKNDLNNLWKKSPKWKRWK